MGISLGSGLESLLLLKKYYPEIFSGSILQLGRQDTYFIPSEFENSVRKIDVKVDFKEWSTRMNPWTGEYTVEDISLFRALGFEEVQSLDFVENEGATIIHDLNLPIDPKFFNCFDVVYDGGTTEHIFDLMQHFQNIDKILKVGGYVIHEVPLNNFVEHGFWQINPTALQDFYSKNNYSIIESWISVFDNGSQLHKGSPRRIPYNSASFRELGLGNLSHGLALNYFVAKKNDSRPKSSYPIQGFYSRHWNIDANKNAITRKPISKIAFDQPRKARKNKLLNILTRFVNR